jgi:hypothetical protein
VTGVVSRPSAAGRLFLLSGLGSGAVRGLPRQAVAGPAVPVVAASVRISDAVPSPRKPGAVDHSGTDEVTALPNHTFRLASGRRGDRLAFLPRRERTGGRVRVRRWSWFVRRAGRLLCGR